MRSISKILGVMTVAFCVALTACGGGSGAGSTSSNPNLSTSSNSPTLQTITVSPNTPSLLVGQSQQLSATALYSDGSNKDVTTGVTWSSSDSTVASINTTGMVQAVKAQGSVTISALLSGIKGTANVSSRSRTASLVGLIVTADWSQRRYRHNCEFRLHRRQQGRPFDSG